MNKRFFVLAMGLLLIKSATQAQRIQLTPALPADWTADFKLHAPGNTTVEGHVENGKLSGLRVMPASRAKDVVVVAENNR